MQWTSEGLIIGVRRHGETSVIAEVMAARHGRTLGLIRGGRSTKLAATLQPGNTVQLTWRARLEEHLGTMTVETDRCPRRRPHRRPHAALCLPVGVRPSSPPARTRPA